MLQISARDREIRIYIKNLHKIPYITFSVKAMNVTNVDGKGRLRRRRQQNKSKVMTEISNQTPNHSVSKQNFKYKKGLIHII